MNHFIRLLLVTPAVFAPVLSLVMTARPSHASAQWVQVSPNLTCSHVKVHPAPKLVCKRLNAGPAASEKVIELDKTGRAFANQAVQQDNDPNVFELTEEESNTAVALFGCDCPVCVRSLRQLRSMTTS